VKKEGPSSKARARAGRALEAIDRLLLQVSSREIGAAKAREAVAAKRRTVELALEEVAGRLGWWAEKLVRAKRAGKGTKKLASKVAAEQAAWRALQKLELQASAKADLVLGRLVGSKVVQRAEAIVEKLRSVDLLAARKETTSVAIRAILTLRAEKRLGDLESLIADHAAKSAARPESRKAAQARAVHERLVGLGDEARKILGAIERRIEWAERVEAGFWLERKFRGIPLVEHAKCVIVDRTRKKFVKGRPPFAPRAEIQAKGPADPTEFVFEDPTELVLAMGDYLQEMLEVWKRVRGRVRFGVYAQVDEELGEYMKSPRLLTGTRPELGWAASVKKTGEFVPHWYDLRRSAPGAISQSVNRIMSLVHAGVNIVAVQVDVNLGAFGRKRRKA